MPSNNQPDVTTPVSAAGRSRFIGVTGNLNGGTVAGNSSNNLGNGSSNANIGGVVYRGAGQSSNQFPVSQASKEPGAPTGGAGQAGSNGSSTNPLSVQENVASRKATEVVAQTTFGNVNPIVTGSITNFPKSTETADFGSSSSLKSNVTLNREQPANVYVGINTPKQYSSNDPAKLIDDKRVVVDTNGITDGRIDGKAQGANSEDKFIVLGDNVQTKTMNTLPGGVDQSQKIG